MEVPVPEREDDPDFKVTEEEPKKNGLFCFMDPARECGADCMSFLTEPAESPLLNKQQQNCVILVSIERLGRYASGTARALDRLSKDAADRARSGQPPPNPLGKA